MWKLSSVAARPYFLNGEFHYKLRQVLVQSWTELLEVCVKRRSDEVKKQREQALKERKEPKLLPDGTLPEKDFTFCLGEVLKGKEEPPQVQDGVVYGMGQQAPDGGKTTLSKDVVAKLVAEAAKIGKVAFGTTGEKPTDKLVDYNQFCKNYSQGDFNAERYCQRKWENIYGRLLQHSKENPDEFDDPDNLAPREVVKEALESPEMGLSTRMVEMLLDKYQDKDDEEDQIKYPELCWRFAKKNIQHIMHDKCLAIFRKARVLDKARSKQVPKAEMEKVLRSPEIGLSEYEADLFIRRYLDQKGSIGEDEDQDQTINYDDVLFGKWEEIPCNPKLYSAFVGLEKNWERIADRFMASDVTTENGTIHIDDFKKLVLELNLDELKDKNAVEQVGNALDPDVGGG